MCLSLLPFAVINIMAKATWGRMVLLSLTAYSKREVRVRARGRNWSKNHGGTLLISLFPVACSASFYIHLSPGVATHSELSCALPHTHQSLIKKMPRKPFYRQSGGGLFLSWGSVLPDDLSLYHVDEKLTSTQIHVKLLKQTPKVKDKMV